LKLKSTILYFVILLLASCKDYKIVDTKDEGVIEYDIKYLQSEKDNPIISLLPKKLIYKFKKDKIMQKVEGWMGVFLMGGVAKNEENYKAGFMKILSEKYVFETTLDGESIGYDDYGKIYINPIDSYKVIAGFKCKAAEVYINDSLKPSFLIFFTKDLKIKNPNLYNPYSSLKYVLLEFQMSFQKIPMKLTATSVKFEKVNDEEFEVPDGYRKVSLEKMQEVINNLM